jgi:MoaA/NifB/PqqE/SkfB family radical SAM enzyme
MQKLVLNLTNRCNFRCHHCLREGATNEDLDLALLERVVPELRQAGIVQIALTGGEPILHPRFAELVGLLAGAGFHLGIVTNGWLHERYLRVIEPHRARIAYLALSLDSHLEHEHDRLRRRGSYARVLEAIRAFDAAGYPINLSHIVSRRTAGHLLAFGNFVKGLNVRVNLGRAIATPGNGDWQLDAEQKRRLKTGLGLLRRQLGPRLSTTSSLGLCDDLVYCTNFRDMSSVVLRYDGDVAFCCDCVASNRGAVLGNLRDEPFARIVQRFPERLLPVLQARVAAQVEGRDDACNDCDACNAVLDGLARTVRPLARAGREAAAVA